MSGEVTPRVQRCDRVQSDAQYCIWRVQAREPNGIYIMCAKRAVSLAMLAFWYISNLLLALLVIVLGSSQPESLICKQLLSEGKSSSEKSEPVLGESFFV